ncbi:hypothetical protein CXB51_032186 [Gossypium anomalum]|uniref:Reverse transcriptase Ty1/copia-type domain-containing protein n=1 Tax=Gossypium anomalum TaxID=47600 RepID=A0A8J6CLM3_9ROSI|nr:hypothetical protein CXB51_032186 [Gossypium anomalum]
MCLYTPNQTPWAPPSLSPMSMPSPSGWPYQMAPTPNWSNPFLGTPMQYAPPSTTVQPHALLTALETVEDNTWFPYSGATHYLTHSAAIIGDNPSHDGPGKVYVGNGNALPVLYSGQSSLITKTQPLHLKSFLFAPGITKNLLSVSKFTRDNQVMFEFIPTPCQVRDLRTKEVLLGGSLHRGLYRLSYLPLLLGGSLHRGLYRLHLTDARMRNKDSKECKLPFSQSLSQYTAPLQLVTADYEVTQRFTYPYISTQNGIVERKHRQIIETGLSMLAHAFMPVTYLNEAFSHAIYLINGLPSAPLEIFPFQNIITKAVTTESQPHTSSKLLILAPKSQSNSLMSTMPTCTTLHTPILSLSSPPTSAQSPSARSGSPIPNNHIPQPPLLTTQNIHAMTTQSKAGVFKPKAYLSDVTHTIRDNIHEAMAHAEWKIPVVRATTIRTILALAVTKGWPLHQVDVNNAFLNGELTEEIFMDQPPGFEVPDLNGRRKMVCKLNKALYGLRQAPRAWFYMLKNFLISDIGFQASKVDPLLFIRKLSECHLLPMAYVDDIDHW